MRMRFRFGEKYSSKDSTNSESQSDVAMSYRGIGDLLMAEKDSHEALKDYEQSLTIALHLVKEEPTNNEWQMNLAPIREKTGEALVEEGRLEEALQEFRDSLAVCEPLTKADPKNAERADIEALTLFRLGLTLSQLSPQTRSDSRTTISRARDILLDLRQRSQLSAADQERLNKIQSALSGL